MKCMKIIDDLVRSVSIEIEGKSLIGVKFKREQERAGE